MRGRPTLTDRPVEFRISIPSSVAGPVELLLLDPVTRKVRHGAKSTLVTQLLRDWLAAQRNLRNTHKGAIS